MSHFAGDGLGRLGAIFVSADGLGPEAKGALGGATAARVVGDVRVFEVTDCVIFDGEISSVNVHHAGERIEVSD